MSSLIVKIYYAVKLLRPLNLFQGLIAVLVTAYLMDDFPLGYEILLAVLVIWSYTGGGNALNDYMDLEIDRINRPERPIPAGLITPREALILATFLFLIGTLVTLIHSRKEVYLIQGLALLLLVGYSLLFKRLPLIGNLVVALILGMAFLFSAALFGNWKAGIIPAILAAGFTLIRELVKDMQDIKGDQAVDAHTFPVRFGMKSSRNLVIAFTVILILFTPVPFLLRVFNQIYLWVVLIAVDVPLLYLIFSIWRDPGAENCGRLAALLKADIFAGLLALFLGKV